FEAEDILQGSSSPASLFANSPSQAPVVLLERVLILGHDPNPASRRDIIFTPSSFRGGSHPGHNSELSTETTELLTGGRQAEGRDDEKAPGPVSILSQDISVPRVQNGILQYTLMEFVAPAEPGHRWTLRDKAARPPPAVPVTSAMPSLSLVSVTHEAQPSDSDFQFLPYVRI
ncbi:hypothetical protein E4U53_003652, partial [Claviceps sorghi]